MPLDRFQVTIPTVTGSAEDVVVNTWYFFVTSQASSALDGPIACLTQFYEAIKDRYPAAINFAGAGVKVYDMDQPKPRPPIYERPLLSTGTGAGTSGPAEVALCLSFHGTRTAGYPAARQRGRVYLGPFSAGQMAAPTPAQILIDDIVAAASLVLANSQSNTYDWVVYSETQKEAPIGAYPFMTIVTGGHVDNAWDTQRRRGLAPSARTNFGALPSATTLPSVPIVRTFDLPDTGQVYGEGAPSPSGS